MRLYCAELYKLLCRKFFLISSVLVLGLLFVYFWFVNVGDERSVVDGQVYTGIQAVRTDREITKEYAGTLTDRKAKEIIDEYGFPSEVEEYYGGFRDENYLNGFVTEQLGNGYMRDWEDYEISTALYPMEQTELGKAARITGEDILFDYTGGWAALLDTLQMGMILGSILILIGVSPVFAEERSETEMFGQKPPRLLRWRCWYILLWRFLFFLRWGLYTDSQDQTVCSDL